MSKRPIGGIDQVVSMGKLGGTQTSKRVDVEELARPDTQTSRSLDEQTTARLNAQTPERPMAQTSRKQERKRQTVYMYHDLDKWIRHHAVDTNQELSDIVNKAITHYRAVIEG